MVTKEDLERMHGTGTLYHMTKTDSKNHPLIVRLNGRIQVWVTRPNEFRQPVKYGLYEYFNITHDSAYSWRLGE
jgi:hypothetical protein